MKTHIKKITAVFLFTVILFTSGCATLGKGAVSKPRTIAIASFNIQIFGESKINNAEVMRTLAKIIRRFDVVAIQEIRSTQNNVMPTLLSYVNKTSPKYAYIISERLGRTGSKEQYAFVYNTKTVNLITNSSYVVEDADDVFEREPFIAFFKSRNFDFKIVNNHIKPEDAEAELKQLAVVINNIYDSSSEKDIVVLGDMNADSTYFNENNLTTMFPLWIQLIGNNEDTTVASSNNTYDRMMTRNTTANAEYTGTSGVFRWDSEYGITDHDFVKKVSDHYPIYAEFRTDLPDDD
jgi:endonuclease/exonuclease/phosphatase family metal-dependent hydrolase